MKVQIIEHFPKDDPECGGDYWLIEVYIGDEKIVTYGDHYHESGQQKAEGFIDGLRHCVGKKNVEVLPLLQIADM